ncbi:hypothetical protein G9A89_015819 [Geosiphon pyriformis]|nr:hypothetical protein G9A89_015819 [Geosiphon pyriformis]
MSFQDTNISQISFLSFCCVCNEEPVYLDPYTGAPSEFCSPNCYQNAVTKDCLPSCEICKKLPQALLKSGQRTKVCGEDCLKIKQDAFFSQVSDKGNDKGIHDQSLLHPKGNFNTGTGKRRSSSAPFMDLLATAAVTVSDIALPTETSTAFREYIMNDDSLVKKDPEITQNSELSFDHNLNVPKLHLELTDDIQYYEFKDDPIRSSVQELDLFPDDASFISCLSFNDPLHPEIEISQVDSFSDREEFSDIEFEQSDSNDEFVDADFDNGQNEGIVHNLELDKSLFIEKKKDNTGGFWDSMADAITHLL